MRAGPPHGAPSAGAWDKEKGGGRCRPPPRGPRRVFYGQLHIALMYSRLSRAMNFTLIPLGQTPSHS